MPHQGTVLPRWELLLYLLASLGFHSYSFYEVYRVSREHEEELDQEFELETDALFGGLKKDATDFEWSFWMDWGKQRVAWLLLGHAAVSQMATLLARKGQLLRTGAAPKCCCCPLGPLWSENLPTYKHLPAGSWCCEGMSLCWEIH